MRVTAVVPALDARRTIGDVVRGLVKEMPEYEGLPRVIVVDDGSRDGTDEAARAAGAYVVRHAQNQGKGAALRTGLERALRFGAEAAVSLDADGQHPPKEAARLALHPAPREALLLGIRDLAGANAPRANRVSNGISNFFLSAFSWRRLADTQCGLRRYPLPETLELGVGATGFAFEAEVLLRALRRGIPLIQEPIQVLYPLPGERVSHFHVVKDPARIVVRVLATVLSRERS
jgi:glycosyltransferase involved in cell wall biosynthesis